MDKQKRKAIVFPKHKVVLEKMGERIKLAIKRRGFTQRLISERTGLSLPTLRKIERGESTVSIGHYIVVLSVLGLARDFELIAKDDELGRKLQDIKLLQGKR